jgi:NAD(P)-dependent dehydrogenase (short-subunit alcohol dehydrogenase family)
MKENGGGVLVNVGSMWAKQYQSNLLRLIQCKKAGLHSFTQHLAMELADYNIRVNAVSRSSKYYLYHGVFWRKEEAEKALEGFNDFHPIGNLDLLMK